MIGKVGGQGDGGVGKVGGQGGRLRQFAADVRLAASIQARSEAERLNSQLSEGAAVGLRTTGAPQRSCSLGSFQRCLATLAATGQQSSRCSILHAPSRSARHGTVSSVESNRPSV